MRRAPAGARAAVGLGRYSDSFRTSALFRLQAESQSTRVWVTDDTSRNESGQLVSAGRYMKEWPVTVFESDGPRPAVESAVTDVLRHGPTDDSTAVAAEWLGRPALQTLVEGFGGTWPTGDLVDQVKDLVRFSDVWNRRSGQSRLDIVDDGGVMPTEDVLAAAKDLGLVSQPPLTRDTYDVVLVLGGLVTGCLSRVEALSGMLESGLNVGTIALLGSFRELHTDERAMAEAEAGAHATTEVDLLTEFAGRFLGGGAFTVATAGDPIAAPRLASRQADRVATSPVGSSVEDRIAALPLHVFASASSDPDTRSANTMDTYAQAASALTFRPGQQLLLVTTRIYRYQHLDAIRGLVIPYGVTVETVGTDPSASRREFGPAWYLQEVRSMLMSIDRLLDHVAATPAP